MTKADIIAHWRKGAEDSLHLAKRACEDESYALALFHCHLAVEKALKALYIAQQDKEPPYTHELPLIASHVSHVLNTEQEGFLDELTNFSVGARYDDIEWADQFATKHHATLWIDRTVSLLSTLLS